jgi:hypothetical protein
MAEDLMDDPDLTARAKEGVAFDQSGDAEDGGGGYVEEAS